MYSGSSQVQVDIKRLSDILRQENVMAVDLLKIDVEGAELSVLEGIDDDDWAKFQNIVLETCDLSGLRVELNALLESKGFTVKTVEAEWSPHDAKFYLIVARRVFASNPETYG
ncbi:hypothetical protein LLEC1_05851 [Akanthomyces lecanii]|uniref:Methyltransferase FkbM domain-containing protein n=1 Tax=Cordyceps confragosa TaxID=2714763 RepID=A0A179II10_CORDF|nr:hypothetical protein LLEC1_05851 [Akanthomyces lecanii]